MATFDSPYERIPTQPKKRIYIRGAKDQLTRDAIEAEKRGLSYGEYMAQKYEEEQKGKPVQRVQRRRKEKPVCINCGFPLIGEQSKFCGFECQREYAQKRKEGKV